MAVLRVRKYGDPALRQRALPGGEVPPEPRAIIADMPDTMYDEVGIGLAAPQVGISLRLIVVADEEGRSVQALLNPAIVEQGGEAVGEEGCLSIPGVFAAVTRAAWVKVEAHALDGKLLTINARGLPPRVLQHEIDHPAGVLFIDRVDAVTRDRIKRKITKEGLREDASRHAFAL